MAGRETVNRQLNIYITSGEAQKVLDTLLAKEKKLTEELKLATDPKQVKKLETELAKLVEPIDRAKKKLSGELAPTFRDLEAAARRYAAEFKRTGDPKALENLRKVNIELLKQRGLLDSASAAKKSFGSIGNIFSGAFLAGSAVTLLQRLPGIIGEAFDEFQQADLAIRNLQNDLENFGAVDALPILTKQAQDLAEKFQFLDNDDIIEAQTKLVTFGKLTTSEIQKLIPVIVDYAAKTGVSVPEASEVFIKALQGQARGLKLFGVNVKETNGIAKNLEVIMTDLGRKVKGAADTFGDSSQGKIDSWRQKIKNAQEAVGEFFSKLVSGRKSANELFDEAKTTVDNYNNSLKPLLERYDELKSKAKLNKEEQTELHGIIQRIVEIVPSAATEINNYGVALDINKQKVTDFLNENKKFLAEKEFKAVDELTNKLELYRKKIEEVAKLVKSGRTTVVTAAGVQEASASLKEQQENVAALRGLQEKLIAGADILINKYGKELSAGVKLAVDEIKKEFDAIDQSGKNLPESDGDKAAREAREKAEAEEKAREAKAAAEKTAAERKRILDDIEKVQDELAKMKALEIDISPLDKAVVELDERFKQLRELAHNNRAVLKDIDKQYYEELFKLQLDFSRKEFEEFQRKEKEKEKRAQQVVDNLTKVGIKTSTNDRFNSAVAGQEIKDRISQTNKIAGLELAILQSNGRKKLKAELDLLDEQQKIELSEKGLTENQKLLIEEKFRQERKQKETDFLVGQFQAVLDAGVQILSIADTFAQAANARENQQLERDRRINDSKKNNFKRQLDSKMITQLQYDRELQKLERQQEKREKEAAIKQFKRNQRIQVAQTLMNMAQGIVSTFAARPGLADIFSLGVARAIQVGIIVASSLGQIAAINAQRPQFEKGGKFAQGGKLGGRPHATGGNPILDGNTGKKIAEIESGELIVNKKTAADKKVYGISGTPSQIISRLNSIHGGTHWEPGARLQPRWNAVKPTPMNFPAIHKYYAAGGRFVTLNNTEAINKNVQATEKNTQVVDVNVPQMEELKAVIASMQQTLDNIQKTGIPAYTIITQHEKQQARIDAIRDDATLKP